MAEGPMILMDGGFIFFKSLLYLGKISNLTNIFQMGWNHQPVLMDGGFEF